MDNSQTEKQQYLFQQIIQKNYDPEQFQEYIIKAKEGGEDLGNWPMNELKEIVSKFQKMCNKQPDNEQTATIQAEKRKTQVNLESKQLIDSYIEEQESISKSKLTESAFSPDQDISNNHYSRTFACNQINLTALFKSENANVSINKFEKKEGGIFEQSYVSFFVETPVLGAAVQRRYSDFQWLKATLQQMHPGLPVPPIAKKGQFRRYDDKHLRKRMMILQMFLNKLLQIPDLKAEPVVENFLTLKDKASFQKFKSHFKATGKPIPFRTVSNVKGSLTSTCDSKVLSFLNKSQRHFEVVQPMVKTLYKDFKGAATALETCGDILKGLGSTSQNLDRLQRKFRKQNDLSYCPNNFFTILSEAVGRLAEQLLNQALLFRTQYYALIKYDSFYMLNVLDSFEVVNSIGEKYQERKNTLLRKKEKLFAEGQIEKWELELKVDKSNKVEAMAAMLPKETKKLFRARDVYGLYNSQIYQEIKRYFQTKNKQNGLKLQHICRNETRLCSEMMMLWVDAETNIMGMKENKSIMKC